jgi:hypothetical protein
MWVPVTTAWRVLRLRMEERPSIWWVAVNVCPFHPARARPRFGKGGPPSFSGGGGEGGSCHHVMACPQVPE